MKWLTTAYGRKNTEALTGMLLLLFLVEHLAANSLLLLHDPAPYRWYTDSLGHSLIVRGLELALFVLFALHIGIGLMMRMQHRRLMRKSTRFPRPRDLATRFVGTTGVVILVFLIVHLARFFVPNRLQQVSNYDLYTEAHQAFASWWYTALYAVSMAALALHLRHGIRSALFSFTFLPRRRLPMLKNILSWIGLLTSLGLAYIAIHLFMVSALT
jgi:succinate dehydrogenase / fumarate reductase, cytochrome b subunit